jgi:hypothetical protein
MTPVKRVPAIAHCVTHKRIFIGFPRDESRHKSAYKASKIELGVRGKPRFSYSAIRTS